MLNEKRNGKGFGFWGSSPAWPCAGRGKGGLPRCLPYGLHEDPKVIGRPTKSPVTEVDFLKSQAQALKQRLEVIETDSECIPRRLASGLASQYKEIIPYVKTPCGLCRRVLHSRIRDLEKKKEGVEL